MVPVSISRTTASVVNRTANAKAARVGREGEAFDVHGSNILNPWYGQAVNFVDATGCSSRSRSRTTSPRSSSSWGSCRSIPAR